MLNLLQSACAGLVAGVGFGENSPVSSETAHLIATTLFRQQMPRRDYDRRITAVRSNREGTAPPLQPKRNVARSATGDDDDHQDDSTRGQKRKADELTSGAVPPPPTRQKLNVITTNEMPELQVKSEETRALANDSKATIVSDRNTADMREEMKRGLPEATEAVRAQLRGIFGYDARTSRSEVAKLARTVVILLLEPVSLRVSSVVQRPDRELLVRERARLLTGALPSVDERREMNRHVVALTFNLFAGCPEFALDMVKLESPEVFRAVYFFIIFSELLFLTRVETATTHVLDDFRHNSELEKRVDRAVLIERSLAALIHGVERAYRYALRNRFLLAIDAAMSEVSQMTQPFNANARNLDMLARAKQRLADTEFV